MGLALMVLLVLVLSPGDQIAGMLAVAVASSRTLEVLDLEGTGLTNQSAQVGTHFFLLLIISVSMTQFVRNVQNRRTLVPGPQNHGFPVSKEADPILRFLPDQVIDRLSVLPPVHR